MTYSSEKEDSFIAKFEGRFAEASEESPLTFAEATEIFAAYKALLRRMGRIAKISDSYQSEVKALVLELREAAANVKALKGFIPICASCKKVRNDDGYWKLLEQFIAENSDAMISHGLCPDCASNYRSLAQVFPPTPGRPAGETARLLDESDIEDPVIVRFLPTLNNQHFATTPLYGDFSLLFQKYVRLARRLKRIARISDSYQFQLQDLKTKFEHASHVDYLTALPNRLDMIARLEAEQARSLRHGRSFALIMADIDHFKGVNDRFGHDVGDQLLVTVARTLSGYLRKEDSCARWGGEEFLILLPETDEDEAQEVAERLRILTGNLALETGTSTIRTSISLGLTLYANGETIDSCIKRADDALYQAKNSGRNRSVFMGCEES
ncbi:MAG: diguanylate cyclase [Geobacteraceae bacterium]|nr:diguanylate cyclase [Geobacteraceae bacterium]